MFRNVILLVLCCAFISSCSNNDNKGKTTTALDTGREFIRTSLNGDFEEAEKLLLKDGQNEQAFYSYESYYKKLPEDQKIHYKKANYEINKYEEVNDSTVIINYSNDYMHKPMDIKVVRTNGDWKIDFKYTYSGNLPID